MDDGDCLQLGIGAIPNAVLTELRSHAHLGVHTEMLSDGVVDLVEEGVVDCSKKNYHAGKLTCSFAMGTRRLYDFVDDNAFVEFFGSEEGIGFQAAFWYDAGSFTGMIAWGFVMLVVIVAIDKLILEPLLRRTRRWRAESRGWTM